MILNGEMWGCNDRIQIMAKVDDKVIGRGTGFQLVGKVLGKFNATKDKYITYEWQGYAVKLAEELNDKKHISLYMKIARDLNRSVLERARMFVRDAVCDNRVKLFMWKVGQLNKNIKDKKLKN